MFDSQKVILCFNCSEICSIYKYEKTLSIGQGGGWILVSSLELLYCHLSSPPRVQGKGGPTWWRPAISGSRAKSLSLSLDINNWSKARGKRRPVFPRENSRKIFFFLSFFIFSLILFLPFHDPHKIKICPESPRAGRPHGKTRFFSEPFRPPITSFSGRGHAQPHHCPARFFSASAAPGRTYPGGGLPHFRLS